MSQRESIAGTPRAAVLGSPIGHSLSPVLHRAAYAACGLDWRYDAIECDEAGLPGLLSRVRAEPGWRGLSLTMPLKIAALPLVDSASSGVRMVGALNTIVVSTTDGEASRLIGHNTDIAGIAGAVAETGTGSPNSAVVLGAGGTARAAVAALAGLGVQHVIVGARDVRKTDDLVRLGERLGITVMGTPWTDLGTALADTSLVVCTAPAGATDSLARAGSWPGGVPLVDVLYDPWPTALAAYALSTGSVVVGGMAVLAHQACEQFSLMTGIAGPLADMRTAGELALAGRHSASAS